MKNIIKYSTVLFFASALFFACQKSSVEEVDIIDNTENAENAENSNARIRTFTCTIADNQDSKISIDGTGKTQWKVDDEIMIHGGSNGSGRLLIKLTAEDISADGKQATISFSEGDLAPYVHSDPNILSHYYAQYPANCVPSGNMYYECCFTNTNNFLLAACDVDDTFVFYNLCSVISFTVSGGYDKVVFYGNNGERVGYDYYQVRVRNDKSGMVLNYHKPGNGFASYTEEKIIEDNSITADGSTVNYLCFPNGANFSNGFTLIFYKAGEAIKTVSTKTAVSLARNDFLPLGNISSHLKDYVPTYTVVGDNATVFGSTWNTFAAENVMTDNGDGTYSKTYNVSAGTYNFKIVKDHSYNFGQWPYDHNQEYIASAAGALTIIFNPSTNTISFNFVEAATYTVAGTSNLFGTNWDETDTTNDMTLQGDGTYVWSKEVAGAMDVEFKIVKNHTWGAAGTNNWPVGPNESYSIPAAGTMYIYFNPADKVITKVFKVKVTIDGNMSEWAYITGTETPSSICRAMKVSNDDNNLYIYVSSVQGSRGGQLWGSTGGYYYFDFDLDNNSSTGTSQGSNAGLECYMHLYLFSGSSSEPMVGLYGSGGDGHSTMSIENIEVDGVVAGTASDSLIEIEISVPRSNLPSTLVAGQTIRVLSWRSKDGSNIEQTYTIL